jgi:hypothetical protein
MSDRESVSIRKRIIRQIEEFISLSSGVINILDKELNVGFDENTHLLNGREWTMLSNGRRAVMQIYFYGTVRLHLRDHAGDESQCEFNLTSDADLDRILKKLTEHFCT